MLLPAAMLSLAGCVADAPLPGGDSPSAGEGVTVSLRVPEMLQQTTRAFGDRPAAGLKLTVLEFEMGSDPTSSFLTKVYQGEVEGSTNEDNATAVDYRIPGLLITESPRVLHFVLAPEYMDARYASEAVVMTGLSVTDANQAYWGRVEFPTGFGSIDEKGKASLNDDAKNRLAMVDMLRNFAKVTASVAESAQSRFELTGFELVNVPTAGTVAPYNLTAGSFPELVNPQTGKMRPYAEVGEQGEGATPYEGVMPPNTGFRNLDTDFAPAAYGGRAQWSTSAAYMYEHPFESTRHTYVLLRGNYRESPTSAWQENHYYKIDLVYNSEESGMTEYYNLIRNYDFHINVKSVVAPGAATPSEAIAGVSFNNISADVDARDMLQISDGSNIVEVSHTHIVFTNDTPVEFLYRYFPVGGKSSEASNAELQTRQLQSGEVLASVGAAETFKDESDVIWVRQLLTPRQIEEGATRQQSFFVVDANGLGREIRMVAHVPYDYFNIQVFPGAENDRPSGITGEGTVSPLSKQDFTIYFDLPAGMPESIFPLTFTLESNRQNMDNNPIGTLVVTSGPTGFPKSETDAYEVPRIKYQKTISYAEYCYKTDSDNRLVTDVNGNYVANTQHTVRCRLRTINALTELPGRPPRTLTQVLISNPYFNCTDGTDNSASWPGVATFTRTR